MSSNAWDASINQIRPVRQGGNVAVADVPNGDPYDLLCDITIGENLNEHVDELVLSVSVINLTTATQVLNIPVTRPSLPSTTPTSSPRSGSASPRRPSRRATSSRRWRRLR
jgi:hypothetical protein